ncbi:hypothetical protein DVH24_004356 [Malus domestica]|uniref:Uncharacterized protein n=1 Tax=Malus domestica TaxID=3750 RepID=A0A498IE84_MALDO|nr:hypothetical protein DVH24_004356 [Malus domestica]
MVVFSTTRMVWWWPELVIGRTGGESGDDATMVMVARCYDVDIVEVDSGVELSRGGRENEKVGESRWTKMGVLSRSQTRDERRFEEWESLSVIEI